MASHHTILFLAAAGLLTVASMTGSGCGRSPDVRGAGGGPAGLGGSGGLDDTVITNFEPCAELTQTATLTDVNMFISVDISGSMVQDGKWDATKAAFTSFFQDGSAAALNVALRFWPDEGCDGADCDVGACATAQVPLDSLANVAHQQALIAEFDAKTPNGNTPMSAALRGAVQWAAAQQQLTPDERNVIILVTDGDPSACCQTAPPPGELCPADEIPYLATVAGDAWTQDDIPVFVVGLPGSGEPTINAIAAAGGTQEGFLITGANPEQELLAALLDIAGQAVDCTFPVPAVTDPNGTLDPRLVRVEFTGEDGSPMLFDKVDGPADCAGGGWYYDDDLNPTTITLCPSTCSTVQGDVAAQMDIALGCECERDEDCGAGLICEDNHCVEGCKDDSECPDGYICLAGRCVPEPGGPCKVDSDCPKGMYCIGGQCSLGGVIVGGEEAVQGGAFNCAVDEPLRNTPGGWLAALAALTALALRRRRSV
jgi:MYXO-CTERM domain-containing protein